MATIRKFERRGEDFAGVIATRLWKTAATLRKVPRSGGAVVGPKYGVMAGSFEIGTGGWWSSRKYAVYLDIVLDDPGLASPLRCRLYEEHDEYHLAWDREGE